VSGKVAQGILWMIVLSILRRNLKKKFLKLNLNFNFLGSFFKVVIVLIIATIIIIQKINNFYQLTKHFKKKSSLSKNNWLII
jgi:C4-dicarboxylate transporter